MSNKFIPISGEYNLSGYDVIIDDFGDLYRADIYYVVETPKSAILTTGPQDIIEDVLGELDWREISDEDIEVDILRTVLTAFQSGDAAPDLSDEYSLVLKFVEKDRVHTIGDSSKIRDEVVKQFIARNKSALIEAAESEFEENINGVKLAGSGDGYVYYAPGDETVHFQPASGNSNWGLFTIAKMENKHFIPMI